MAARITLTRGRILELASAIIDEHGLGALRVALIATALSPWRNRQHTVRRLSASIQVR